MDLQPGDAIIAVVDIRHVALSSSNDGRALLKVKTMIRTGIVIPKQVKNAIKKGTMREFEDFDLGAESSSEDEDEDSDEDDTATRKSLTGGKKKPEETGPSFSSSSDEEDDEDNEEQTEPSTKANLKALREHIGIKRERLPMPSADSPEFTQLSTELASLIQDEEYAGNGDAGVSSGRKRASSASASGRASKRGRK